MAEAVTPIQSRVGLGWSPSSAEAISEERFLRGGLCSEGKTMSFSGPEDSNDDDDERMRRDSHHSGDKHVWARNLLEKAGWREGRGLGANENQGLTAPIRAEVKMDRFVGPICSLKLSPISSITLIWACCTFSCLLES